MSRAKKSTAAAVSVKSDAMISIARNDDLLQAQTSLHQVRPPRERGKLAKGWLTPEVCWAIVKQFGVLGQLLRKIANQCVSKGWKWEHTGVEFDWSGVSSNMEANEFQVRLKDGIMWAHVEGGAGLVWRLDEVQRDERNPEAAPVVPENVRGVDRIEVYPGSQLRPLGSGGQIGKWNTCERFEIRHDDGRLEVVHRSRVVPLVVNNVPMGGRVATLYSSTTGWPPSWLDGVIDSLQSWRDAESTTDNLLFTISLLVLELDGARAAMTSPRQKDREEFATLIDGIAKILSSHGLLALPGGDKLSEVGRNTGGADKLVEGKKQTFVADTGFSQERVLMKATAGLGDTTASARLNDHETIEGLQETMCTPAINRATDFELYAIQHAARVGQYTVETPTKWVIRFNSLATQTPKEQAETRKLHADSRAADAKSGVSTDVLQSDPDLDERYPALAEQRAAQALAQEQAAAAAASANADPNKPPANEALLSAAEIGARLGVRASTILAMRKRGIIRGWNVNGRWRFSWTQVQAALTQEFTALAEAGGEVGDAARRALDALRRTGKVTDSTGLRGIIDAATWAVLESAWFGAHRDALPPGVDLSTRTEWGGTYGASEAIREIYTVLERFARTEIPVLVLGESGTGKEGMARGLHDESGRAGPMASINCAELGSDASARLLGDGTTPGVFEQANGGTLFLDEVGELSEEAQAVLLRALSGEVRKAGGVSGRVDVRVVAATLRPIGIPGACKFRRDLYERLAGVVVELPPLRERGEDVIELAQRFIGAASEKRGYAKPPTLSREAVAVLRSHPWPGNIRELLNAINRGVVFAGDGGVIEPEHLQLHVGRTP